MASNDEFVVVHCPHCDKGYRVAAASIGRRAACKACNQEFELQPKTTAEPVTSSAGSTVCPVCQVAMLASEPQTQCPGCATLYHTECWEYNQGCGVYGCEKVPPTQGLGDLEIPAAYWGKDTKQCPVCNEEILAAAVRCRHCGTTFQNAAPELAGDFRDRAARQMRQPALRKRIIILMILSLISCAAPFVAVFGYLWYRRRREDLTTLPSVYRAMAVIAVGVAAAQTILLLVFGVIYSLSHS